MLAANSHEVPAPRAESHHPDPVEHDPIHVLQIVQPRHQIRPPFPSYARLYAAICWAGSVIDAAPPCRDNRSTASPMNPAFATRRVTSLMCSTSPAILVHYQHPRLQFLVSRLRDCQVAVQHAVGACKSDVPRVDLRIVFRDAHPCRHHRIRLGAQFLVALQSHHRRGHSARLPRYPPHQFPARQRTVHVQMDKIRNPVLVFMHR